MADEKRKEPLDRNDPTNYIGDQYKFLEEDGGYLNNVRSERYRKPHKYPFGESWRELKGASYHRNVWVLPKNRREDTAARRRLERDPNHAMWEPRYALLRWWRIKIHLIGSDNEGRQIISIRQGQGEPIFLRVGRRVEVFVEGRRIWPKEDE